MQRAPRASNTPCIFSRSLQERLNMYALAASAAGVSLLALSQPSAAKVVYTKAHQVIGTNGIYNLDLNHDGIVDFVILETEPFNGSAGNTLLARAALGNAIEGRAAYNRQFAAALKRGARIGPGEHFSSGQETMAATWSSDGGGGHWGQWLNVNNRYLGLKFKVNGKTHYGWARLTVQLPGNYLVHATLTGYAYETVVGKAIRAGQTAGDADDAAIGSNFLNSDSSKSAASVTDPSDTPQSTSLGALALGAQRAPVRRRSR